MQLHLQPSKYREGLFPQVRVSFGLLGKQMTQITIVTSQHNLMIASKPITLKPTGLYVWDDTVPYFLFCFLGKSVKLSCASLFNTVIFGTYRGFS